MPCVNTQMEARRWALKEYPGLEVPEPKPIESSEGELAPYVGRYSRPYADIELGMLLGRLAGQQKSKGSFPTKDTPVPPPPPPMPLTLCENDRLLVLDGPARGGKADIVREPDGSIGWLRYGGRLHVRQA